MQLTFSALRAHWQETVPSPAKALSADSFGGAGAGGGAVGNKTVKKNNLTIFQTLGKNIICVTSKAERGFRH